MKKNNIHQQVFKILSDNRLAYRHSLSLLRYVPEKELSKFKEGDIIPILTLNKKESEDEK